MGKFPGIFSEKISRHFPEFPEISKFPEICETSWENLTRILLLHDMKSTIVALQEHIYVKHA